MNSPLIKNNSIFLTKIAKKMIGIIIFVLVFEVFLFPAPTFAKDSTNTETITSATENINVDESKTPGTEQMTDKNGTISDEAAFENNLPINNDSKIKGVTYRTITAYNSEVGQCDSTPCITANGFNVCEYGIEDTIAANWLKFGTKVRIPELFGDRIFVVRDRMNKKHADHVDVWMKEKIDAKKFGVKLAKIEILEP
jgi:3D (Asp-Asp-Asp) domain-containing protein